MESQEIFNIIVAVTIILLLLGVFIFLFVLLYQKRNTEYRNQLLSQKVQFEHSLLQAQLEIQEQTFKTISQEIHDNIGQMLSLARMNLSKFEIDRHNSDEAVLTAKDLVSKSVSDLRDLSKSLNTDSVLAVGFLKAVETELHLVEKTSGIAAKLTTSGIPQTIQPQPELILFRIVQEALHNSIKHAAPTLLAVITKYENDQLHLTISDNGSGFNPAQLQSPGIGLHNMQSRSKMIGATWLLQSLPGNGTSIQISFPIKQVYDNDSFSR